MTAPPGPVLVMGAGAIGCYVGGALQGAGETVHFVGRPRVLEVLRTHGLRLSDLDGGRQQLPPQSLRLHDAVPTGLRPSLVLLCVKSAATAEAARALAGLPHGTPVLSLQNGLRNADTAAQHAPELALLPGMVSFNVASPAPGHWHRGTGGVIAAQDHLALRPWVPRFAHAGLPLALHEDMRPVQWGKLLLNLNNPVNALSRLPLRAQLLDAGYRRVLAALVREALATMKAARIRPARVGAAPPTLLPAILSLPTPLFRVVAARMLRVDAQASSSMADDVAAGRPTEIDALAGEVVRLAESVGRRAPLNERIAALLAQPSPPHMTAEALQAALGLDQRP